MVALRWLLYVFGTLFYGSMASITGGLVVSLFGSQTAVDVACSLLGSYVLVYMAGWRAPSRGEQAALVFAAIQGSVALLVVALVIVFPDPEFLGATPIQRGLIALAQLLGAGWALLHIRTRYRIGRMPDDPVRAIINRVIGYNMLMSLVWAAVVFALSQSAPSTVDKWLMVGFFLCASIQTLDKRLHRQLLLDADLPEQDRDPQLPAGACLFSSAMYGVLIALVIREWQYAAFVWGAGFILAVLPVLETVGNLLAGVLFRPWMRKR